MHCLKPPGWGVPFGTSNKRDSLGCHCQRKTHTPSVYYILAFMPSGLQVQRNTTWQNHLNIKTKTWHKGAPRRLDFVCQPVHPKQKKNWQYKGYNTEKDHRSNNQIMQSPILGHIKHQETFEDKKGLMMGMVMVMIVTTMTTCMGLWPELTMLCPDCPQGKRDEREMRRGGGGRRFE